jgi:hypothetical protein
MKRIAPLNNRDKEFNYFITTRHEIDESGKNSQQKEAKEMLRKTK